MKEILRDYKGMNLSQETLAKAEHIRESIQSVIGEDTQYKVLGIKSKTITYKRGAKTIHDRNKESEKVYTKSSETFSAAEFGFFNNLNDLKDPKILEDYVDSFVVIPDEVDPEARQMLMMRKTVNSLGQIILYKTALIFRPYNEQEKLDMQAKEDAIEAEALGFTVSDNLKSLASVF